MYINVYDVYQLLALLRNDNKWNFKKSQTLYF